MTPKYLTALYLIFSLFSLMVWSFQINTENYEESQSLELIDPIVSMNKDQNNKRLLETINLTGSTSDAQPKLGVSNPTTLTKNQSSSNFNVPDTSKNQKVSNTQFNGLILSHNIPLILSNQEYFQIRGRILSPADNQPDSFIGFAFFSTTDSARYDYVKHLEIGTTDFSILLNLKKIPPGEYEIGANVAWEWSNSLVKRTITTNTSILSLESAPQPSTNFRIDLKDNGLFFFWDQDNKTAIDKITFSQSSLAREYVLSNFVSSFEVPYKDFSNFKINPVTVTLVSATSKTSSLASRKSQYSIPVTLTFTPAKHLWSKVDQTQISLSEQIPWRYNVGQSIHFAGTTLNNLKNKIVVEEPTKTFANYYFTENEQAVVVGSSVWFDIQIPLTSQGTYIIEVLNENGQTVMNRPVYVGDVYPLLPDYIDLQPDEIDPKTVSNAQPNTLEKQRAKLLDLINKKRAEYGAGAVTENSTLDNLAQSHAQDMVTNEYFSHVNLDGQGPQDRATRLGINQQVEQIIAINLNLTQAHLQVSRSPSSLQTLVNPQWTSVGLGLVRTSDKTFKVTEIFAGSDTFALEITEQTISALKSKIILEVISQYSFIHSENVRLSTALDQWLNMSIEEQESAQFGNFMQHQGFNDFIRKDQIFTYGTNFFSSQLQGSAFLNPQNIVVTQFGVGIRKVSQTQIEIYIVFV